MMFNISSILIQGSVMILILLLWIINENFTDAGGNSFNHTVLM
ncbi:ASFV_G_ACD_00320 [African swine fever virus]|uniref:ASFV_G_ACD_00320 n=1 Tax=African swine fever virus TaxID=10497 RepID=A0A6G6AGC7_ASF|nr:ASFV_G_ACD_00320 [African swine fever virus]